MVRCTCHLHDITFTESVNLFWMEVFFGNPRLDHGCRTRAGREQIWGPKATAVGRRLFELSAVANLADAGLLPGAALQPDSADGSFRIRFRQGIEIVLRANQSCRKNPDAADDAAAIASVTVEDVLIID